MKIKSLMYAPMSCLAAFLCAGTPAEAATVQPGDELIFSGAFAGLVQLGGLGPGQITVSPIFSSIAISSGTTELGCICAAFHTDFYSFATLKLAGTVGGFEYWYQNGSFLSPPFTFGTSASFSVIGGDTLQLVSQYEHYGSVPGGNGNLAFSLQYIQTPLPAAFPLFAVGVGVFGLLGWHRKRKLESIAPRDIALS